jgi:hypothetical protein
MKSAAAAARTTLVAVLASFLAISAWGQEATGTITGTVADASGGAVANANVVATNTGTGIESRTTTSPSGQYIFVQMLPGMYSVTVEAAGFRKTMLSEQRLVVASTLHMNVSLEVGQVTESVTVDANAPQVNTDDAQLGQSMTDIPDLPLLSTANGRDVLNLVGLQPGVSVQRPENTVGAAIGPFSVNGQRTQANNFLLDGADDNDLAINTPDAGSIISPQAIGEFTVITGAMKAEYGHSSGAVVESTIKSGSNSFHGEAEDIFRNTVLNANNFFLNENGQPNPKYIANDYDASVGGPVKKDKTFFFASYLGFRREEGTASNGTVFSAGERAAIDQYGVPAAKAIVAITPLATNGGNQWFGAPVDTLRRDQGLFRIDHRFSDSNNLSLSYFTEQSVDNSPFSFGGTTLPGFGQIALATFDNVALHDTQTFSPTLVNEATAAFHRLNLPGVIPLNTTSANSLGFTGINPDDPSTLGPPDIFIGNINVGDTYQGPQTRYDNNWQYHDSVSWIKGRHTFKFGMEYSAYEQNQLFDFINNGYYIAEGGFTEGAYGLAPLPVLPGLENSNPGINDFAQGYADGYVQATSDRQGYRDKFFSAYAQDDFKISRNFTMNIGLRWDYGAPFTEVHDEVDTFRQGEQSTVFSGAPTGLVYPGDQGISNSTYSPSYTNFGPRLGFAWDPTGTGKLSIRAGGGVFYSVPESELFLQFLGAPPYGAEVGTYPITNIAEPFQSQITGPTPNPFPYQKGVPGQPFDFVAAAAGNPTGLTMMSPGFATPYAFQYNFQIQYQIARNWIAEAAYVGSQGRDLEDRRSIDPAMIQPGANSGNDNFRRSVNINNPEDAEYGGAVFGDITEQLTDANSDFNSLQLSLNKRTSYGLAITNAYTYGHCIDDASGLRTTSNPYNALMDRGNCDTDVRQSYVGTAIYELPFYKEQQGFLGHLLGGFNLSTVVTLQSGIPFDITDVSGDRSLTGAGDDRPEYIGGDVTFADPRSNAFYSTTGYVNDYFDGVGGGTGSGAPNPYFARVGSGPSLALGAGYYGDLGRNVFHGPGILNADISVGKTTRITEGQSLTFRAQAFNFFNHAQFQNPVSDIGSSNFGEVTLTTESARIVQLSLQYKF